MKLKELYHLMIDAGRSADPSGDPFIEYPDSQILCGDPEKDVKNVLVGIDIGVEEVVMADRLREKGAQIDLIISHHPQGRAISDYPKMAEVQLKQLVSSGITEEIAKKHVDAEFSKLREKISFANINKVVQAAELFNIPMISMHTPADNLAFEFLNRTFSKCTDLAGVTASLNNISGFSPQIFKGSPSSKLGKFWVDCTGAQPLPAPLLSPMLKLGYKTIIATHIFPDTKKALPKHPLNYVLLGHMPADSLGMSLLLARISHRETLNIIPCGGFEPSIFPCI